VSSQIFTSRLQELLESNTIDRVVIGYSGGVDSHVLLHQVVQTVTDVEQNGLARIRHIIASHINHAFSPNADAWQSHCEKVCEDLGVDFIAETPVISSSGNKEDNARKARYQTWLDYVQAGDLLLLAHHLDDQIETALFYFLRGSSPFGMQAIPPERPLGDAILLRPMINTERSDILDYAREHQLKWVEDESNLDSSFDRNFLRNDVIPKLKARWPQLPKTISQSLERDSEARQLIETIAESDFELVLDLEGGLSIDRLREFLPARQRNIIRHWVSKLGLPLPSSGLLNKQLPQLLESPDSPTAPGPSWKQYAFVRYDGYLYIVRELPGFDANRVFASDINSQSLPEKSVLELNGGELVTDFFSSDEQCRQTYANGNGKGLRLVVPANGQLTVKFRQGGEAIKLSKTRTLKNVFQEQGMPPWLRDRIPLVFYNEELVAIAGLPGWLIEPMIAKDWRAAPNETGLYFRFHCQDKLTLD
jgi:tRNA(Ile)-lysidine synthase